MLDTNICVALLSTDSTTALRETLYTRLQTSKVFVSSLVLFELWYGVAKSRQPLANSRRSEHLFGLGIDPLDFSSEAAGRIRASLEAQAADRSLGLYDTLIAGQALARSLTLVTANQCEFARVRGLLWEDWLQPTT